MIQIICKKKISQMRHVQFTVIVRFICMTGHIVLMQWVKLCKYLKLKRGLIVFLSSVSSDESNMKTFKYSQRSGLVLPYLKQYQCVQNKSTPVISDRYKLSTVVLLFLMRLSQGHARGSLGGWERLILMQTGAMDATTAENLAL